MGRDTVSKEDLRFYATAPTASGQARLNFPRTYDLDDPTAYYQAVVIPRKQRKLSRALWGIVNRKVGPKAGGDEQGDEEGEQEQRGGAGGSPKAKAKPKAKAETAPTGKVYPAGKRLGSWETTRSIKGAPKDKQGKRLCWDFSCWSGCPHKAQACQNSHEHDDRRPTLGGGCTIDQARRPQDQQGDPPDRDRREGGRPEDASQE